MCDRGSFVKNHCTSNSTSSVCVICEENTYIDHPNGHDKCFRCKDCDTWVGLIVKYQCTSTSNTVCECKADHFCQDIDCDYCDKHTQCPPGQYVRKPGTVKTDTVCANCPQGQFSNETDSVLCFPWTTCSSLGLVLYKEGTSSSDSLCKEGRSHIPIVLAVLFPSLVGTIIVRLMCNRPMIQGKSKISDSMAHLRPERNQSQLDVECKNNYPLSREEEAIREGSGENSALERT
ncbi:Tumor necrosis factor receptor superfamily member [Pristimantis euphronides]